MRTSFNPYGKKSLSHDYGTYFNLLYYYVEKFETQPSIYEFSVPIKKSTIENLDKIGAKRVFECSSERLFSGELIVDGTEICYEFEDALVYLFRRESLLSRLEYMHEREEEEDEDGTEAQPPEEKDFVYYRCRIAYQNDKTLEKLKSAIERDTEQKKKGNIYLLCNMDGMLGLQRFDIKLPSNDIDLEMNYGSEASEKFKKVVNHLSRNKNGLVLLSGDPGTGKSTFIKYLTTKTSRKVIYISSAAAEQLTNPDFLSFIMRHRNAVLLLEDAEKVLRSRSSQDNEAISNILNITDGILGDCLNIMVIATFNIDRDNIDPALVRKGRLLLEHHFKALPEEAANILLDKMETGRKASGPMTLAEIYNPDDNFHEEEERRKVGF
jgi:adenosyl cobinamide kinase/adenosyl cobinamide phosphate guanylyltransferase